MKTNSVFGHVAIQLPHPENWATEALSFILQSSPTASRAFSAFVRQAAIDCPEVLHFETQQVGSEQSIPDMKCFDEKGLLRVVVENKFWAGLTENQPVTYIRELPDGVDALVLFVVPQARLEYVWDEVVKRCNYAGIPAGKAQKYSTMTIAGIGGEHYIGATSWTTLLESLSTAAVLAAETECHNNITQLQGLVRAIDEEEILPLRGDELTNLDMARRIINLSNLALEIVYKAESEGLCSRGRAAPYKYGSGTYIQIGEYRAWLGFDAFTWRHLEVSPIWVTFSPPAPIVEIREKLVRFRTAESPRCFDMNNRSYLWLAVPIFLATGVEKQSIIDDAVDQIRELRDELGSWEAPETSKGLDPEALRIDEPHPFA